MTEKILLVDDDRNILGGYQRVLRKRLDLDLAQGGQEALAALVEKGPYAVVVADMQMPGMSGLQLLAEAQFRCPDTVRIMLTGNTDQKTAADAVNQGRVFRFLTKPCSPQDLAAAVEAGLRQHQLVRAERELLEGTLMGAIEVLSDLLAGVDPEAFSLSMTIRQRCHALAQRLGPDHAWATGMAAMLAPLGRLALPRDLHQAEVPRPEREALLARVPEVGARLIQNIPRMGLVADIIRHQARGFDGSGLPEEGPVGAELPLGARILRAVADFTRIEAARHSRAVAMESLRLHPRPYDPSVLEALEALYGGDRALEPATRLVSPKALVPGMVLAADLATASGQRVLGQGLRLGASHLELLRNLGDLLPIEGPVAVSDDFPEA